jgi:hypothetical protein
MANRFLSNIKINDAYTFPASDGSNGQVIVTDGAGNLSFASPSSSSSASVIYRDNFTGDGSTTVFYLQNTLSNEDQTNIYIDGVYQEKGTYSLSNNAITFTTPPPNGDSVEVMSIAGINVGPTTIYQDNFTGDGTTTDFTLEQSVSDEVKTMVYFNGVYQFKGTYSLNGTLMSFDTAPANGVAIEVISIASAAASDYNQKVLFYGKATEAISKGDAVMFAGAQGDHFLFSKATQAAIASNHELFIGLASQDLSNNEYGYVTEFGNIKEIDTSDYTAGDILWFDAGGSTAGALTTTEPAPPLAKIQVAAVIRSHQNEGVLFIRPTWYHELGELHDVSINTIQDKDLLVYNSTAGLWENSKTVDTLSGNTFTATTLAGTLSTAAQPNVTSVGTLSSLTVSGDLAVDTNTLYVDATNNRVGIGTSDPQGDLQVIGGELHLGDTGYNTGIKLTGDTTGLQISLQDEFGSSDLVTIQSGGNVGIGTTSPDRNLHIKGSATGSAHIEGTTGDAFLEFTTANNNAFIGVDDSLNVLKINNTNTLGSAVHLAVRDNGFLGIGDDAPSAKLHVVGGDGFNAFKVTDSGGGDGFKITSHSTQGTYVQAYDASHTQTIMLDARTDSTSRHSYFNGGGNVGIGTTTPTGKLNIQQSSLNTAALFIGRYNAEDSPIIQIGESTAFSGSGSYGEALIASRNRDIVFSTGDFTDLSSVNTAAMIIEKTEGNVGIGTASPSQKLEVNGNVYANKYLLPDGGDLAWNGGYSSGNPVLAANGDEFRLYAAGNGTTNILYLSNSRLAYGGNVGIGTTSPSAKLHVAGQTIIGTSSLPSTGFWNQADNLIIGGEALSGMTIYTNSASGNSVIAFADENTSGSAGFSSGGVIYYEHGSDNLVTRVNGGEAIRILDNRNVGIGTTSPSAKLHVEGTSQMGWFRTEQLGKSCSAGETAVLNISATAGQAVFVKVYIRVSFVGNGALNALFEYATLVVDTQTSGSGTPIVQYLNESTGSFQVSSSDFVVTRPSNGTIRITYTNQNVGSNSVNFFISGKFNSASIS